MAAKLSNGNYRGRVRDPRTGKQIATAHRHRRAAQLPHLKPSATRRSARPAPCCSNRTRISPCATGGRTWTTSDAYGRGSRALTRDGRAQPRAHERVRRRLRRPADAHDRPQRRARVDRRRRDTCGPCPRSARCSTTPSAPGRSPHRAVQQARARQAHPRRPPATRASRHRPDALARRRADPAELRRLPVHDRLAGHPTRRGRRAALGPARLRRRDDDDRPAVVSRRAPVQGAQARLDPQAPDGPGRRATGCSSSRASPSSYSPPLRGTHYTPSTRNHHWNRVRCTLGLGDVELYLATRHFFVTYAIEQLDLVGRRHRLVLRAPRRRRADRPRPLPPPRRPSPPRADRREVQADRARHRPAVAGRQARPDAAQRMRLRDTNESPNPPVCRDNDLPGALASCLLIGWFSRTLTVVAGTVFSVFGAGVPLSVPLSNGRATLVRSQMLAQRARAEQALPRQRRREGHVCGSRRAPSAPSSSR